MTTTTSAPIGVRDEYEPHFGRQTLTLWTGAFASSYVGSAIELPRHNGFMVTVDHLTFSYKIRVECEAPRTNENYQRVDTAIEAAVHAAEAEH